MAAGQRSSNELEFSVKPALTGSYRQVCALPVLWAVSPKPPTITLDSFTKAIHSCHVGTERNDLSAALGLLQKVRPVLHHFGARLQVECMVVSGAYGIARRVGKL